MSATVGYVGTLKESGTAVPVTGEACSFVSGTDPNKVYQVTATGRRVWDPTVPVTIKDAGTPVATANYVFDYLSGTVTFVGHAASGAITVDGSYLPVIAVALVRKASLKLSRAQLDTSTFDDGDGWKRNITGIGSGSIDVEMLSKIQDTFDATAGGQYTFLTSDRPKVLEIGESTGTKKWRLWMKPQDLQEDVDVQGLVVGHMTWAASANSNSTISYAA